MQWELPIGFKYNDYPQSGQQTADGGYIAVGWTEDLVNSWSTWLDLDLLVAKVSKRGLVEWQKVLGGYNNDGGESVLQTADGGYVVAGFTDNSQDGDVGLNHGGRDFWLVKLDGTGTIQWQKLLGGSGNDDAGSVQQTADGGFILLGESDSSASGDVTGTNHGERDLWIVKLAGTGPTVLPVSPGGPAPTDTDADGKYDDVNGNGRADFADVVLYFNQMTWITANEPVSAFDYNGNGRIDFADVVWLFNNL